ncbi:SDR family NAD(P)-dependent oxidoreductase [Bacillus wiedmannii]|uniref:SDR family NAD(P)-dependent oxidoreductase n=1 Tax=Bacillus wiedmannii TaxID=1890302 RepID=UPI00352B2896
MQSQAFSDSSLADIAYTLQVGREVMEERLAVIVGSIKELEEKLQSFVEDKEEIFALYCGQVKRNKEIMNMFIDEDLQKVVGTWIVKGKYEKLLELWVKGLNVDWNMLYDEERPNRISLPTYPFAKESYWVPQRDNYKNKRQPVINVLLHPLLHQNTSDFSEQRFSSTFTGEEFFLTDHVIKGRKVLSGVAHLEMAREAVSQATGACKDENIRIQLKDVMWAQPIVIGEEPLQIDVGLYLEENGEIFYKIYRAPDAEDKNTIVYSQGRALLSSCTQVPNMELKVLKEECNQGELLSSQYYEYFRNIGIDYGPAHQGIEKVYIGHETLLAKLSLPSCVYDTQDEFVLHPTLVDSALQASVAFIMGSDTTNSVKTSLPFILDEIEVLSKCTSTMWALVQSSQDNITKGKNQQFDINMYDEKGNLCVRMKGLSSRVLEGEIQAGYNLNTNSSENFTESLVGDIMLTPIWDVISLENNRACPSTTDRIVIIGEIKGNWNVIKKYYPKASVLEILEEDTIEDLTKKIEVYGFIDHILWIAPHYSLETLKNDALIGEQSQGVIQVFKMIKAFLHLGYGGEELGWSIVTIQGQPVNKNEQVNPTHASIYGLIGSMAKEYPNWNVRMIDLEANSDWPVSDIFYLPTNSQGNVWAYRDQSWYRQSLVPLHCSPLNQTLYRTGGVYVVIGGAGGLGEVWSEYMIRNYRAQIIWIGRRDLNSDIQAKLDRLETLGPTPHYIKADASDQVSLQEAYERIRQQYMQIHGVIHSAIVLHDQSLQNMEEIGFVNGLSAKVNVSVRMAQVFDKEPLDFVLFFSSINAFVKSPGQSNYTSGCTFKDAFAHQLSKEWSCPVKVMNWGYWGSVGIVASKDYQNRMEQVGIGSIEPPEAMEALEILLAGPIDQMALIKIIKPLTLDGVQWDEWIEIYTEEKHSSTHLEIKTVSGAFELTTEIDEVQLIEKVQVTLIEIVSKVLNVKTEDIDTDVELGEYGFERIKLNELVNILNREFNIDLAVTIIFDYSTINSFAVYLVKEYKELLMNKFQSVFVNAGV